MGKRRRRSRLPEEPVALNVEGLSHEGRGVARVDGKTVFVHGALAGEQVMARYTRRHRRFDEARVEQVVEPSDQRVTPRCPSFGICGGCSLQQMPPEEQIRFKEEVLLEQLQQFGAVTPREVLPAITGPVWGYRHKARLAVKDVPAKGRVLVGFREKHSPFVTNMTECHVLDPRVAERLPDLSDLVASLSCRDRMPQIEVATTATAVALVFRNLQPFTDEDYGRLVAFAREHGFIVYEQPGNEDTVAPIWPVEPILSYQPAPGEPELQFQPTDFTQINADVNTAIVQRVLARLAPGPQERVLDLFCGIGNFSLPLARRAGEVIGVEGDARLVARAAGNAERNGIANARFHTADLAAEGTQPPWPAGPYDTVVLDPPRSGAAAVMPWIAASGATRVIYIACNPATLARDVGQLVKSGGYVLESAGVMDMFPHTAHVESMAVLTRDATGEEAIE
ncbi:MAG: 23S rRNA (uracil(1939)-C(5))-methyltransferase RlmD [Ectothiorhodospiraceae bacterium]